MVRLDLSPSSECQMRGTHRVATPSKNRLIPGRLWQRREDRFDRCICPLEVRDEARHVGFRVGLNGGVAPLLATLVLLDDLPASRRLEPTHDAVTIASQVRHYMRDRPVRQQAGCRSCRIGQPGERPMEPRVRLSAGGDLLRRNWHDGRLDGGGCTEAVSATDPCETAGPRGVLTLADTRKPVDLREGVPVLVDQAVCEARINAMAAGPRQGYPVQFMDGLLRGWQAEDEPAAGNFVRRRE